MYKVETYENPEKYFENIQYNPKELHVMGTSSLSMYMKEDIENMVKNRVWTYCDLEKAIYIKWHASINQIKMKVEIRKLLESFCDDAKMLYLLNRDLDNILETYKYLLEANIRELRINDELSQENRLIRETFNAFSKSLIVRECFEFSKVNSKAMIAERLNEFYRRYFSDEASEAKIEAIKDIDTIYFYNLNYIDLKRYIFFERMKYIGINIVFRIPYYKGYDNLNRPWQELYKFIDEENWTIQQGEAGMSFYFNKYLNYICGKNLENETEDKNLIFKKFSEPIEFKKFLQVKPIFQNENQFRRYLEKNNKFETCDMNRNDNYKYEREYIAFSDDELNRYMKDEIIDTENKIYHFFEYPEGKFLKNLYECERKDKEIKLSYKTYVKCLVSGWVELQTKEEHSVLSGAAAASLLRDLEPYMEGVNTLEDIKGRLNKLVYLNEFSDTYDDLAKSKADKNRIKKYLSNPLKVFSYVNGNRYDITIKQLILLTNKFERIIFNLISDDNLINVNEHIRILQNYWINLSFVKKDISNSLVYSRVAKGLGYNDPNELYVNPTEMREFLNVLLNIGNYGNDDEINNTEKQADNLIKTFEQIDGFIIDGTKELYITDLSFSSMEKYINSKRFMPKYIGFNELYEGISNIKNDGIKSRLLRGLELGKISKENVVNFFRFYIVSLLSFYKGLIHFSWIDNLNEFDYEAPIFKILKNLYAKEDKDTIDRLKDTVYSENNILEAYMDSLRTTLEDISIDKKSNTSDEKLEIKFHKEIAPIAWRDLDFCPKKFYYSSILTPNPVYTEDFHQRIVFSILGKLFKSYNKDSEEVEKYFFYLFPQWNDTTKENLVTTSYYRTIRKEYKFDNISFPYHMKDLQILRSKTYENGKRRMRNAYNSDNINSEEFMNEFVKDYVRRTKVTAIRGNHCSMCPHNLICSEGEFAIERISS